MIELFDSASHPTITGQWNGKPIDASFQTLVRQLDAAGYKRACAVGLPGRDGYSHQAFAEACGRYQQLIPIAGCSVSETPESDLDEVVSLGFRGIKLHALISGFSFHDWAFVATLKGATRRGLVVFLCTYLHGPIGRYPDTDPLYDLAKALKETPACRIVLLHGGDVGILRWAQFIRHNENLLLDISYTMMKFRGSSLEMDFRFLFRDLNRRTCFGVDHPDYRHEEVRHRIEELLTGLSHQEAENVAFRNLERFLRIS